MHHRAFIRVMLPMILFCVSPDIYSLGAHVQQKYPNVLLTADYGILDENDLAAYTWDIKPIPFSAEQGTDYNYWQCFPRDHVALTLEDFGYSSEDIGGIDNYGYLYIKARSKNLISHEYFMRRPTAIDDEQETFNRWQKLMKNEKYVCLAGRVGHHEKKTTDNKIYVTYFWTFDRIKTKKGCDSYFANQCNRIYPKAKTVSKA